MKRQTLILLTIFGISLLAATTTNAAQQDEVVGQQPLQDQPTVLAQSSPSSKAVTSPTEVPRVVKLMAYNILETGARPAWEDVVKEENADLLMLSETGLWVGHDSARMQGHVTEFNNFFTDEDPYIGNATSHDPTSTGGEAVLSRFPVLEFNELDYVTLDDDSEHELHHSVLHEVVEIFGTEIHVVVVHYRCCEGGDESRENDMEGLINYMDDLGDVPIIYAGDFNSFSPYDTGELSSMEHGLPTGNLGSGPVDMLLNSDNPHKSEIHEWTDTYRALNPYTPGYTYIDSIYKSRIDFIFLNSFFDGMLVNSTVADTPSGPVGSDHFPLDLTLNWDHETYDLRPPFRPINVSLSVVSDTEVKVNWTENIEDDLSHYKIYRNSEYLGQASTAEFVDDTAVSGTVYRYQVSAVDTNGNEGMLSTKKLVDTSYGIIVVPNTPPNLAGTSDEDSITLTWEVPENGGIEITSYEVYRLSGSTYYHWETTDQTSFTDTKVVKGRTYTYLVTAVNEVGESARSDPVSVKFGVTSGDTNETSTSSWSWVGLFWGLGLTLAVAGFRGKVRKGKR